MLIRCPPQEFPATSRWTCEWRGGRERTSRFPSSDKIYLMIVIRSLRRHLLEHKKPRCSAAFMEWWYGAIESLRAGWSQPVALAVDIDVVACGHSGVIGPDDNFGRVSSQSCFPV